jgi:putative FmdB family regulatory protein
MPTYDYVCRACGHRIEVYHGLHATGPTQCPNCHSHSLRKAIAAPAVVFKGSGWAKKDRGGGGSTKIAADASGGDEGRPSSSDDAESPKGVGTHEPAAPSAPSAPTGGSGPAPGID